MTKPLTKQKAKTPAARQIRAQALRDALTALPKTQGRSTVGADGAWNNAILIARKRIEALML